MPPREDGNPINGTLNLSLASLRRHYDFVVKCSFHKRVARDAGLTLSQFALAWALRLDNVAAAIIGASRPDPALFEEAEHILAKVSAR
jgi:aryl-alcohol dehydrogenase-like predicted oxidoreductase